MMNPVIHKENSIANEPAKYQILGLNDWEFFDTLVSFLIKNFNAEVITEDDGLYTRKWQLFCDGELFFIEHHEDAGNWFQSCSDKGDSDLMRKIAKDLEERLKDIPYED